jgi:hypothetical protein
VWRRDHLPAHRITDALSGTPVGAHPSPPGGLRKAHLGHTDRFVVDHVACDVVVLQL